MNIVQLLITLGIIMLIAGLAIALGAHWGGPHR